MALAVLASHPSFAKVVSRPNSVHPVMDLAGVLKNAEMMKAVNDTLDSIYQRTKCQVMVVTVPSLDGNEPMAYADELFDTWGIGDKKLDNGLLLLIKPKTGNGSDEKGGVAIATGYALEGEFTDAACKRIQQNRILPYLKDGDNYDLAVKNAVDTIATIIYNNYRPGKKSSSGGGMGWLGGLLCFGGAGLIVWFIFFRRPKLQPGGTQPDGIKGGTDEGKPESAGASLATLAEEERRRKQREEEQRREEERRRREEERRKAEEKRFKLGGGKTGGGGAQSTW